MARGRRPRLRRALLAVTVVTIVGAGGALAFLLVGRSSGDGEAATEDVVSGLGPEATPAEVFAHAADQLEAAGSFSYDATTRVEATELTAGSGTRVFTNDVSGDVVLPDMLRESGHGDLGWHTERISIGTGTAAQDWLRQSAYEDDLGDRPWSEMESGSSELDLYLLPGWLDAAVDHRDGGEDASGRRVTYATVPVRMFGDLGMDVEVIHAEIELVLDGDDMPRRVVVDLATRDLTVESDYDLRGLGGEVTIDEPPADQLDATPWFNEEDLALFAGPTPLGLAGLPEGWTMLTASVSPGLQPGCASATVEYGPPGDLAQFVMIDVMPVDCAPPASEGTPFEVAGFSGSLEDLGGGEQFGVITSGDTAVVVVTSLSAGDLRLVLATLTPLDVQATPDTLEGVPAEAT